MADSDRRLTREGTEKTRTAARGLKQLGVLPELVLTSPYLRALETAQLAALELGVAARHQKGISWLEPGRPPAEAWNELSRMDAQEILCVGHAPHLDELIAFALGLSSPVTALKKAGVASLRVTSWNPPAAVLLWLLKPDFLRMMAK